MSTKKGKKLPDKIVMSTEMQQPEYSDTPFPVPKKKFMAMIYQMKQSQDLADEYEREKHIDNTINKSKLDIAEKVLTKKDEKLKEAQVEITLLKSQLSTYTSKAKTTNEEIEVQLEGLNKNKEQKEKEKKDAIALGIKKRQTEIEQFENKWSKFL